MFRPFYFTSTLGLFSGSFTSTPGLFDLYIRSCLTHDASPFWQGSFTSTLDLFLPLVRSFLLCLYSRSLLPLHQVSLPLY